MLPEWTPLSDDSLPHTDAEAGPENFSRLLQNLTEATRDGRVVSMEQATVGELVVWTIILRPEPALDPT